MLLKASIGAKLIGTLSLLLLLAGVGEAQWQATPLTTPAGYDNATPFGGDGSHWCTDAWLASNPNDAFAVINNNGIQEPLGSAAPQMTDNASFAGLALDSLGTEIPYQWSMSGTPSNLLPAGYGSGVAWAVNGNAAVGLVNTDLSGDSSNYMSACYWLGGFASGFNLLPKSTYYGTGAMCVGPARSSDALDRDVFGYAILDPAGDAIPVVWRRMDQNPVQLGSDPSATVYATDGTYAAGYFISKNNTIPAMWDDATLTVTNLLDVANKQANGSIGTTYWNGICTSVGAANGITYIVGKVTDSTKNIRHAAFWQINSDGSKVFTDLNTYVSGRNNGSWASSVWSDGTQVVVYGWQYDTNWNYYVPMRWTYKILRPKKSHP